MEGANALVKLTTARTTCFDQMLCLLVSPLALLGLKRKLVVSQGLRCNDARISQVNQTPNNMFNVFFRWLGVSRGQLHDFVLDGFEQFMGIYRQNVTLKVLDRYRFAEKISLIVFAMRSFQKVTLLLRLYTLGDHAQAQTLR